MRPMKILIRAGALLALTTIGCSSPDDRLVEISREAAARQAEQNRQIARQSQEVAETARHLVEADAKSRQEMIAAQSQLQQEVQSERKNLDRQFESLETERKQLATERRWDPILATAIWQAATLVACVLPIALGFMVLWSLRQQPGDEALGELLVHDLLSETPLLLEGPRPPNAALENDSTSASSSAGPD